jgi:drug/metabolite transporter (DMT)-like permease
MTNSMTNYAWFLSQLSTIVYVPVFFGLVWYNSHLITPEMKAFPQKSFFYMGAFDALGGLLSMIGGVHTSGSLQALLSNAIIPFTMGLSRMWLGERFSRWQILGASVILAGVSLAMVPSFFSSDDEDGSSGGSSSSLFIFLFFLNNLPSAVSSVYKDVAFNNVEMEVNYLQAWVALWQLVFGFLLIPLNTLSLLGPDRIPYSEMGSAFMNGLWCFLGYNHVVPPHCRWPPDAAMPPPAHGWDAELRALDRRSRELLMESLPLCDVCQGAWVPVTLYVVINMLYNYFMVAVIRMSGSSWLYIIMTLRLPLVQLVFSIPALNNPPDSFGWPELLGLSTILMGLALYKLGDAAPGAEPDAGERLAAAALTMTQGSVGIKHTANARARSLLAPAREAGHYRSRYYARLYGALGRTRRQPASPADIGLPPAAPVPLPVPAPMAKPPLPAGHAASASLPTTLTPLLAPSTASSASLLPTPSTPPNQAPRVAVPLGSPALSASPHVSATRLVPGTLPASPALGPRAGPGLSLTPMRTRPVVQPGASARKRAWVSSTVSSGGGLPIRSLTTASSVGSATSVGSDGTDSNMSTPVVFPPLPSIAPLDVATDGEATRASRSKHEPSPSPVARQPQSRSPTDGD